MDKVLEQQISVYMTEQIESGVKLSDLQKMVNEKFNQHLTYMEIRILASGLKVDWNAHDPVAIAAAKEKAKREAEAKKKAEEEAAAAADGEEMPDEAAPAGNAAAPAGKVTVTVNKISRPGWLASGQVTFSSGSTADWFVDQTGRPGLDNLKGEPPTREDAQAFMVELQKLLG